MYDEALISLPLFAEYEAVLGRPETQRRCPLTATEQTQLLDAFLSRTRLVEVHYRWRPNLPDEGDNHVLELAVAAGDAPIVTFNAGSTGNAQAKKLEARSTLGTHGSPQASAGTERVAQYHSRV